MKVKNILITGGNGFLGRHLVAVLSKKYQLFQLNLETAQKQSGPDICYVNLTNEQNCEKVISWLRTKAIDVIIHLASALCSPEKSRDYALFEENIAITKNMIRIIQQIKPAVFMHASSIAVYPNQDGVYDENSVINMSMNNDCLYGLAKFNAEVLFNYFLWKEIKVIHLRLAQIFGKGMRQDRIIPMLIKELKAQNTITLYGNGERVSNFIHVKDVARVMQAVLENPQAGTFNVVNKHNLTYCQLAEMLIQQYGCDQSKIKKIQQGLRIKPIIRSEKLRRLFDVQCDNLDFSNSEVE